MKNSLIGVDIKDFYVGDEAWIRRGILCLEYPVPSGFVYRWDDIESAYYHTYFEFLQIDPKEHPALLMEPPLNPRANRETDTTSTN